MNKSEKKTAVALRLAPEIVVELKSRSVLTGISQARIVESALNHYFGGGMKRDIADAMPKLGKWAVRPLTRWGSQVQSLHRAPSEPLVLKLKFRCAPDDDTGLQQMSAVDGCEGCSESHGQCDGRCLRRGEHHN